MIKKTDNIRFIIFMGVTGSGKSTLGSMLAERLGWEFFDGDDYHSPENVDKMSRGIPLTDADRAGWLDTLAALILSRLQQGQTGVLACSALKQSYRDRLNVLPEAIRFVFLKGSPALISARVNSRDDHYMKAGMVESQFAALEEPTDALVIDIDQSPSQILQQLITGLRLNMDSSSTV